MLYAASNILDIIVTTIAVGVPAAASVYLAHRKQAQRIDQVQKSVATSNGKTSGQYIEELAMSFQSLSAGQAFMQKQLAEHTVQDAANFASLEAQLDHISEDQKGVRERVAVLEEKV